MGGNKKTITVDKAEQETMLKKLGKFNDIVKKYKIQTADLKTFTDANERAEEEIESLKDQVKILEAENKDRGEWIDAAKDEITTMKGTISELESALQKSGGDVAYNRKTDLVNHVISVTKSVLFRNWKFVEDQADLVEATHDLIQYLTIDKELDDETFVTYYKDIVQQSFNQQRNYVQGECKKRAKGMSLSCVLSYLFYNPTPHFVSSQRNNCCYLTQNFLMITRHSLLLMNCCEFGNFAIWIWNYPSTLTQNLVYFGILTGGYLRLLVVIGGVPSNVTTIF